MGLKLGQNIKFKYFFSGFYSILVATKLSCRDIGRDILLVATSVAT